MAMLRVLLLLSCLFLLDTNTYAEINDVQSWWNITATGPFHHDKETLKFKYWLEAAERLGDHNKRETQRLLRPGLGYALNQTTSIWLGAAWVNTAQPLTTSPFAERRIWQQLLWVKTYTHLTLTSRTRLEERFLENNPKTAWRIRELLKFSSPVGIPALSIVGSDELFWHHNNFVGQRNQGLDQNRFFMGIGYKINAAITAEIGYLNQFIYRRGVPDFLSNNISTTLLFNFN